MKKAFGIVDILIAFVIIGVIFALMNHRNPIIEEHARIDVQKQQADEMIDKIKQLREQNSLKNEQMLNDLGK